jgi:hypothetical protein
LFPGSGLLRAQSLDLEVKVQDGVEETLVVWGHGKAFQNFILFVSKDIGEIPLAYFFPGDRRKLQIDWPFFFLFGRTDAKSFFRFEASLKGVKPGLPLFFQGLTFSFPPFAVSALSERRSFQSGKGTGGLRGRVVNEKKQALPGVQVSIERDPLGSRVTTNAKGEFFLFRSPVGIRSLRLDAGQALPKGVYGVSFRSVLVPDRKVSVLGDLQLQPRSRLASLELLCLSREGLPIQGVRLRLRASSLQGESDSRGVLRLSGLPPGTHLMDLDAVGAGPPSNFSLPLSVSLTAGTLLRLPPVHIPIPREETRIHGLSDQILRNPNHPGYSLEIPQGSVVFPKGIKGETLSLQPIPAHLIPVPPPQGLVSFSLFSIQPSGTSFKVPVRMTVPNLDRIPPGQKVSIFAWDLKVGKWKLLGQGTVSKNGKRIRSDGPVLKQASLIGVFCPTQSGTVSGKLSRAGVPVVGARISSSAQTVFTDRLGRYQIKVSVGCGVGKAREVSLVAVFETQNALLRQERKTMLSPNGSKVLDFAFEDMKVRFWDDENKKNQNLRVAKEISKDGATSVLLGLNRPVQLQTILLGDRLRFWIQSSHPLDGEGLVVDRNPHVGSVPTQPKLSQVEILAKDFFKPFGQARVAVRYFPPLESPVGYQPILLASYVRKGKILHQSRVPLKKDLLFKVVGTPVCWVHGIRSGSSPWGRDWIQTLERSGIPSSFGAGFQSFSIRASAAIDYGLHAWEPLERTFPIVREEILRVHRSYRRIRNLAHSMLDLVAHSTGGIQVRNYLQKLGLREVPVRRVLTLGTPHLGTSLADRVLNLSDPGVPGSRSIQSLLLSQLSPSMREVVELGPSSLLGDLAMQDLQGRNALIVRGLGLVVPFFGIQGIPKGRRSFGFTLIPSSGLGLRLPGSDGMVDQRSPSMGWPILGKSFTEVPFSHFEIARSVQAAWLGRGFLTRSTLAGGGVLQTKPKGIAPAITHLSDLRLDPNRTTILTIRTRGLASSGNVLAWEAEVFQNKNIQTLSKKIPVSPAWIQGTTIRLPTRELKTLVGFPPHGRLSLSTASKKPGNSVELWLDLPSLGKPQWGGARGEIHVTAGGSLLLKGKNLARSLSGNQGFFLPLIFLKGRRLQLTSVSSTHLGVQLPMEAESGLLKLRHAGGFSGEISVAVSPRVDRVFPWAAQVGERVVVEGGGFGTEAGQVQVWVGGVLQALCGVDRTRLSFVVKQGTLEGPVQVFVQGLGSLPLGWFRRNRDQDADGMPDAWERLFGLDPLDPEDAKGDLDQDSLNNAREFLLGTHPRKKDSDGGGLEDGFEVEKGLDPLDPKDDGADPDGDGLPNPQELQIGTNPHLADSDGDRLDDGTEYLGKNGFKTDPRSADSDRDLLTDGEEVLDLHTNPLLRDTDGDGLTDGEEVRIYKTDPLRVDSDRDGLSDFAEVRRHLSDPLKVDTDGDGLWDGTEIRIGTSPLKKDSDGDGFDDFFEYGLGSDPTKKNAWTRLVGKVRRKVDGKPVAHARVKITGTPNRAPFETRTKVDGRFQFNRFPVFRKTEQALAFGIAVLPGKTGRALSPKVLVRPFAVTNFGFLDLLPLEGPLFLSPQWEVGKKPGSVTLGDVDGDGLLDLVSANMDGNSVTLLLQRKNKEYLRKDFSVGGSPRAVALGDVNGDGLTDLVTANDSGFSATVLMQTKSGTFQRKDYSVGGNPRSIALGDLNGDGLLDLITGNDRGSSVSVLSQTKSGGFVRKDYSVGGNPRSIAIGDLNGDRRPDLVTANSSANSLTVLLQTKTGGFFRKDYPVGKSPRSVALGDLNRDGLLDLVTANIFADSSTVLLQTKSGSFVRKDFNVGKFPRSVVLGDLNKDGLLDFATANSAEDSTSVLLQTRTGGFVRKDYSLGRVPRSLVLGDVDKDGLLDLITANFGGQTIGVLYQRKSGGFALPGHRVGKNASRLATGDLNGDGLLDVVTVNTDGDSVTVLLQSKSAGFIRNDYGVGKYPTSVALGDLNRDGRLDIVSVNYAGNSVSVLLQSKQGKWVRSDYSVIGFSYSIVLGDVNRDGFLDIAVASFNKNIASLLLQNRNGGFVRKDVFLGPLTTSIALGDVNGDGLPDLLTTSFQNQSLLILLQNKKGGFSGKELLLGKSPKEVRLGDLNKDGLLDMVVGVDQSPSLIVLLQKKAGGFLRKEYKVGYAPYAVNIGDCNGDGLLDLVSLGYAGGTISVLLQSNSGNFVRQDYHPGCRAFSLSLADFNLDGLMDLVLCGTDPNGDFVRVSLQRR